MTIRPAGTPSVVIDATCVIRLRACVCACGPPSSCGVRLSCSVVDGRRARGLRMRAPARPSRLPEPLCLHQRTIVSRLPLPVCASPRCRSPLTAQRPFPPSPLRLHECFPPYECPPHRAAADPLPSIRPTNRRDRTLTPTASSRLRVHVVVLHLSFQFGTRSQ